MSFRGIRVPTSLYCPAGFTGAEPLTGRLKRLSPISSPYVTDRLEFPSMDTTPLDADNIPIGLSNRLEASCIRASLASAAAERICGDPRLIAALEYVPPWLGVTVVSSWTAFT